MLKKTLEKMKERIEAANNAWEEENDSKIIAKFKEIIDNGQQPTWVIVFWVYSIAHRTL